MSWEERFVTFEGAHLGEQLGRFYEWQVERWPRLSEARAGLVRVRHRRVAVGERHVDVQWNPGRVTSTTAKVDTRSIEQRPCFLCPDRLPPEEHGVAFGDMVVLANPAPILDGHLVLAHREHIPQEVAPAIGPLLAFAHAARGAFSAVYNGPRSGASAPDHLHLQAVRAGLLPEEKSALDREEPRWLDSASGRAIVGFRGPLERVEPELREAALGLGEDLNLLATACTEGVVALLFPRGAHRPACYFAEDPQRCVISPGAIDMAGVIVTVRERDFERVDRALLEGIFSEVSLPRDAWSRYRTARSWHAT